MTLKTDRSLYYKITFICFSIFIFTSGISITVSQGFLLISFLLWIIGCLKGLDGFQYHNTGLDNYINVFLIISVLLAFMSPSILHNLAYLKDFWLIFAFVIASSFLNSKDDIKKIVYIFVFTALFQAIAGYIQYFTNVNFLDAYRFGIEDERSKLFLNQLVGFLGHHLTFGGYMMMLSIPIFYLAFYKGNIFIRPVRYIIKITALSTFFIIILSWARSVIISFIAATIPTIFKTKKLFLIILVIILSCLILVLSEFGPSKDLIENLYNESSTLRFQIWTNAYNLWKRSPVLGVGGGNYKILFKEEVEKTNRQANKLFRYHFPSHVTHPHNDYLNQLVRKGVIGLLAYLIMLCGIFIYMCRNFKNIEDRFLRYFYMGLFGSFTAFLLASMFQCFFTDEENLVMFWLNIGILAAIVKVDNKEKIISKRL